MKRFSGVENDHRCTSWRFATLLVLAALTISTLVGSMFAQDTDTDAAVTVKTILSFSTMIGDPGNGSPANKAKNVIRGYVGPDSPWLIKGSEDEWSTDSHSHGTSASRRNQSCPLLPRSTQLPRSCQLD